MKINKLLKTLLILGLGMALLQGSQLFSEGKDEEGPRVIKGAEVITIKGVTRHWKDTNKISLDKRNSPRRMKPILNFESPRKIVRDSGQSDPVVQKSYTRPDVEGGTSLMPDPDQSFAGMNLSANGAGWPPDTNGDVGPTYYIQTVNTSIGIYNKSTGALVSATTFDDFFEGAAVAGTPCDENNNGDPIVLYDQYAQRWFLLDFAWAPSETDGSYYSIAVSKTSDPTGAWWLYAMRADDTLMNDYPKCGIWHDGIYITANMFQFTGGFQGSKIWAIKTPDLYNGTLTAQSVSDSTWYAWSLLPSNAKGSTPPPGTAPNYMYSFDPDEWGYSGTDVLAVFKYDVDWNTPANTTWTGATTIPTAAFVMHSSGISQQGTGTTLDSLASRLMYSAFYRNFGTHESVYLCHTVDVGGIAAIRWYEVRISGGSSSIYQQGTYKPDSHHRWMPSIAADKNGNIAVGYSVSSSSLYPGIRYAGRLSTDPAGVLSQGEATLIDGAGYQTSFTRWGDYSMMTTDPDDDETFWFTSEYYATSGTNWQTRIGSFKMASSPPPSTIGADFNSDGKPDILWRYYGPDNPGQNLVWYMNNNSTTSTGAIRQVSDVNWKFVGTGDFNSDGKTDILLRYDGAAKQGKNLVWYMDGTTRIGYEWLETLTDLDWKIEGTGDFNNDGKTDILWRYYGPDNPGQNMVWLMDGATRTETQTLKQVSDLNWKIEGTGDFNSDGKTDILLRYYGAAKQGKNLVWYMNGTTRIGYEWLKEVTDLNWKIEGTGDFNNDGKVDILLRYYGAAKQGKNLVWYMDGATRIGYAWLDALTDLDWDIENN